MFEAAGPLKYIRTYIASDLAAARKDSLKSQGRGCHSAHILKNSTMLMSNEYADTFSKSMHYVNAKFAFSISLAKSPDRR